MSSKVRSIGLQKYAKIVRIKSISDPQISLYKLGCAKNK